MELIDGIRARVMAALSTEKLETTETGLILGLGILLRSYLSAVEYRHFHKVVDLMGQDSAIVMVREWAVATGVYELNNGVLVRKLDKLKRMRAEIVRALSVLNTRDHFNIPEDTLTERANNLIQILNSEFGLEYTDKQ